MDFDNPILDTDSYKFGHHLQYPPHTAAISHYIEARGPNDLVDVVFFGLQMFLKGLLARPVTRAHVEEAEAFATAHGQPFNRAGWMHIVERHGGILPLEIEALPEGVCVRRGVPLVQVVNTDPACYWLPGHIETAMLRAVWYPSTIASQLRKIRRQLAEMLEKTADRPGDHLPRMLLDFGARGVGAREQAGLGGAAHLAFFVASDNVPAVLAARRFYGATMAATSMPAAEHTTITAWGGEREAEAYGNMIDRFARYGALSVVSDSYDINLAITEVWGKALKEKVKSCGATIFIRPDSGDPIETPVHVVKQLDYVFGSTMNAKGYRVLSPRVRVIQGDGLSVADMGQVLRRLEAFGFSAENIVFAMGGGMLQKVNRDIYAFAMKANGRKDEDGRWHDVWKRPATMNVKASKAGRQAVVEGMMGLEAVHLDKLRGRDNHLRPVWRNGELLIEWSLEDIRTRLARFA